MYHVGEGKMYHLTRLNYVYYVSMANVSKTLINSGVLISWPSRPPNWPT